MASQSMTVEIQAQQDVAAYTGVKPNRSRASLVLADFADNADYRAFTDRADKCIADTIAQGSTPDEYMQSANDMLLAFAIRDFMLMCSRFIAGQCKYVIVARFN